MIKKKEPKYRAMKFNGDDQYSWAVFNFYDVTGFRSPITYDTTDRLGIKPIITGCTKGEAAHYIKNLINSHKIKEKNG